MLIEANFNTEDQKVKKEHENKEQKFSEENKTAFKTEHNLK